MPRRKLGSRIDEVLELCDLKRVRHKIIGKLSKGFRQRVGIAEAILAEPPVIIMDEPTIGLDPAPDPDRAGPDRQPARADDGHHLQPHPARDRDDLRPGADHQPGQGGGAGHAGRRCGAKSSGAASTTLELAGEPARLAGGARAVRAGAAATQGGEPDARRLPAVTLTTEEEEELGEPLLRRCIQGLRVRALSRAHPTLEDVFLAATRRSWERAAGSRSPASRPGRARA